MSMNCTVFFPLPVEAPVLLPRPTPRKVSQKERRKKERYLRSQGLRVKEGK